MLRFFGRVTWGVFNCLTGSYLRVEKLPFEIGSGEGVDLRLEGPGVAEKHCSLQKGGEAGLSLVSADPEAQVWVNGAPSESLELQLDQDYAIRVGPHFLALRGSKNLEEWRAGLAADQWFLTSPDGEFTEGPFMPAELCQTALAEHRDRRSGTFVQGMTVGFFLEELLAVMGPLPGAPEEVSAIGEADRPPDGEEAATLFSSGQGGLLTCPVCWLSFDVGDMMHVAVHDSLRGDPVLGEDAPQRFHPTRYNDRGQALDAMGLPCTETACPHCRRVLPPGLTENRHHIFSIIGDQSAGKSYYLSVLVKVLPTSLYQHFSVVFQDADPTGNAMLNDMKKTLFSALTPAQARLVKTQLEGAMYERLPRHGRMVALPRPFVFSLAATQDVRRRCSVIFYDNAGEHFQPGRDTPDSPGAQHVASSAGLFFLFDPFNHPEFRRRMEGMPDPQMEKPIVDQQDVLLAELKVRITKLLRLRLSDRLTTPLAVLAGKCDAWMQLLGAEPFRNPLGDNLLDMNALRYNSEVVRNLMLELCPSVVANAETLSERVMYFPVSSFGHSPVKISAGDYAPDPRRLRPVLVEVPSLWVLSLVAPELVPAWPPG